MSSSIYESTTCSRCGGSGKYSYNQIDGDRCYGCGGTGYKLTKRGAAANQYFRSLISKPASAIQQGDNVLETIGLSSKRVWQFVKERSESVDSDGKVTIKLVLSRKGKETCLWLATPDQVFLSVRTSAEVDSARDASLAYQATLTKAGTVSKKSAVQS